ncbi:MAG: hypothetical protein ABSG86_00890 [Thermoguttaceae bacterium]
MPRLMGWVGVALVGVLLSGERARAEGVRPADTLLPDTTVGFLSATNYDNLAEHWNRTPVGKLLSDPVMEPFEKDLRQQIRTKWATISDRLGIHLEDLDGVPAGEAALALIRPKPGEAAVAMLIDVSGRLPKAQAVLATARAGLLKSGAAERHETVAGATLLVFDLPPAAAPPQPAGPKPAAGAKAAAQPAGQQTVYFLGKNLLVAVDNLAVARGMLQRLAQQTSTGSLAEVPGYQKVMQRCAADVAGAVPQVRWFVYPLGYVEAVRAATPPAERRRGKTIIEMMRNQGIAAVQGVGGYLDLAADGYQFLYRTSVYAPGPYVKSMKMAVLPNKSADAFLPQAWVPGDIATYTTLYVDILNAFDHFGNLYDEVVDESGAWAETLKGEIDDPNGPQVDLRKELVQNLGQRVTMISDYKLPITPQSERLLFAIEVKSAAGAKAVAKAVEKCLEHDASVNKRIVDGRVIWETVEEEETKVPSLSVEIPSLTPKKEAPKPKADEGEGEDKEHFLPHGAITVTQGHLLIASHIDFLLKILKPREPATMLRNNQEFLKVWKLAQTRFAMTEQCGRDFWWTDEKVRPTYELVRQGKMPESETLLARTLNSLSGAAKKGEARRQRIKGGKLPDYQVVQRALGPATVAAVSEPTGWFFKGVLLPKETLGAATLAEKPAAKAPVHAQD